MVLTPLATIGMQLEVTMDPADAATEFSGLLHQHRKIVFKVAASYAWTEADRADLAQEIATQLWSAYPTYDRSRPFTTWMYRVALNTGMAHARAESMKRRFFTDEAEMEVERSIAPAESADEVQALLLLSQAMALLNREERALLLLYLEARTSGEIAEILGLSTTNVTTRISRIRHRLSTQLS